MAKPVLLVTRKLPEAIEARAARDYDARARSLLPAVRAAGLRLIVDRDPGLVAAIGADGWHATSMALRAYGESKADKARFCRARAC